MKVFFTFILLAVVFNLFSKNPNYTDPKMSDTLKKQVALGKNLNF